MDVFFNRQSAYLWVNYAPLLADLFLYSYEANFIRGVLKKNEEKLSGYFKFTFLNMDDVLSLNNSMLGDFVDRIYQIEFEVKDNKHTDRLASYLNIRLEIDSEAQLRTKLYYKIDDFNFSIVNFPFICRNIPAAPAYISELIQSPRACGSYKDFLIEGCY